MGKLRNLFHRKENPANRSILATVSPGVAKWTPKDYGNLAKAGYQECAVAFGCISLIASTASRINWILKKGKDEVETHPLLDLLRRPNENESGSRFVEKVLSFYLIAGNSYILKVHGVQSRPPRFLYSLRPDRMRVIPSADWKNPIQSWEYRASAAPQVFEPENVLHLLSFHPTDDWYGLSKLEVAGFPIDILAESMRWNKSIFQNDLAPTLGLNIKGALNEAQRNALRNEIQNKQAGADNARRVVITEGEASWTPLIVNPKDLDWMGGNKQMMRWICAVFNVWSGLLGDNESTTYSNYQEGRKALYEEATLPLMDMLRDELQYWLVPTFGAGLTLDYDRDSIEALQEDRGKKWAYLGAADWISTNEKRAATGYDAIKTPGADEVLVGMGKMPLSDAVAPAGDLTAKTRFRPLAQGKALGGFWRGANERKALWQNFERRIAQKERSLTRELAEYLKAQGEAVASRYRDGASHASDLLNKDDAVKAYVERFRSRYQALYATARDAGQVMTKGALYEFADDGKAGRTLSDNARQHLERLIAASADVITDETIREIQDVLKRTLDANLTTAEVAEALRFKLADTMSPVRSRRIARTETGMLENSGNLEGFRDQGATGKIWVCSFVPTSRDAHMDSDGQEVGIDEAFTMQDGSQLDYPGDRSHGAPAGELVNCLCTQAPVMV